MLLPAGRLTNMITHITVDRDCVSTRALHIKRLKHAANYRRRAVTALREGDRPEWRKLMSYMPVRG